MTETRGDEVTYLNALFDSGLTNRLCLGNRDQGKAPTSDSRSPPAAVRKLVALMGVALFLSGCAQLGPDLVRAGRNDYNVVLRQTNDEEVLLNLVRVRYGDRPLFLNVSSVSTSFTWDQGASADSTVFPGGGTGASVGIQGNLDYSERPTITYTPLGGADFVKSVLTPADLDTLVLLSNGGWRIDRLLRIMANRMNGLRNAPRASGPTPSEPPQFARFKRATTLMRAIQKRNALDFGYSDIAGKKTPVMSIAREAREWEETRELKALLGLAPERDTFPLNTEADRPRPNSIGIETRSLTGMFFFLAHGVEVPQRDQAKGRVMVTRYQNGEPFDWNEVLGDVFQIRSQAAAPENAQVAIEYRGSWFYLDDSDLTSKYSLLLVEQLASLLGGQVEKETPVLTIPVGGTGP